MKSTLIVATLLAAALMSASAVPAFATKNTGGFQQSSEGNKAGGICSVYAERYSEEVNKMNAAKDKTTKANAREAANWFLGKAWAYGCAWADA